MTAIDPLSDEKIVESWEQNAVPWTNAVRDKRIESRKLVTDSAIVEAVMGCSPRTALDIGCGEGWLTRALGERGVKAIGVDVVAGLIARASQSGGGDFRIMSYEEIATGALDVRVDLAIANFSLIGKESVEGIIRRVPAMLNPGGWLVIQTLHPVFASGDEPYADGWRKGSWAGFSNDFTDPAPWYFRTLGSWVTLLESSGLQLSELREPLHPSTGKPASVLFLARFHG